MLYGPPGVGKTTMVNAAASEFGFKVIEMNASDARSEKAINAVAGPATAFVALDTFSAGSKGSVLFMDEVDGIAGNEDRIIVEEGNCARSDAGGTASHDPHAAGSAGKWASKDTRSEDMRHPSLAYTRAAIGESHAGWLRALEPTMIIDGMFACHGTPDRDDEYLLERVSGDGIVLASVEDIGSSLSSVEQHLVLCGHSS